MAAGNNVTSAGLGSSRYRFWFDHTTDGVAIGMTAKVRQKLRLVRSDFRTGLQKRCEAMYEGHFQLDRRPFAATPDPGCCYLSPTHRPHFEQIVRCVEQGQGISILTGPAGIGKSLLAQVLLAELQDRFTGVYLGTGQFPTRRALLQAILYELGQPYGGMAEQELRLELNTALRNLIAQRDGLLLILDEAHLLADRLLEEIRLLADLAQSGMPLVRVVLCGNPEFEERLTAPALSAFNQRVACQESLETLLKSESIAYLRHRIEWAGGVPDQIFELGALQLIADASDGVPRCLNQLAEHSLTQAYLNKAPLATEAIVRHSLEALQHLPLRWNASALLRRNWKVAEHHEPTTGDDATLEHASGENASHIVVVQIPEGSESAPSQTNSHSDTETGDSSCFEFGAGGDTYETQSAPVEASAAEEAFEFGADSSVASDIPSFQYDDETADSVVEILEAPTPVASLVPAEDGLNRILSAGTPRLTGTPDGNQVEDSDLADSASAGEERVVSIRVSLNHEFWNRAGRQDPVNDSVADARSSVDAVEARDVIGDQIHEEDGLQSMEFQDSDAPRVLTGSAYHVEVDPDQPRFSWLKHSPEPASHEVSPVSDMEITAHNDAEAIAEVVSDDWQRPQRSRSRSLSTIGTAKGARGERLVAPTSSRPVANGQANRSQEARPILRLGALNQMSEEVVVDRYASLDATHQPQRPSVQFQRFIETSARGLLVREPVTSEASLVAVAELPVEATTDLDETPRSDSATKSPDRGESMSASDGFEGHPVDRIDSLCALIETEEDHSNGVSGVELITDWGIERIDVDLPADVDPEIAAELAPQIPVSLQDLLSSTVLEVGLEVRHVTNVSPVDPVDREQSKTAEVTLEQPDVSSNTVPDLSDLDMDQPHGVDRATLYDIVVPEAAVDELLDVGASRKDYRLDEAELSDAELSDIVLAESVLAETRLHEMDPYEPVERSEAAVMRATPHSRFHNLFSTLRRRQQGNG